MTVLFLCFPGMKFRSYNLRLEFELVVYWISKWFLLWNHAQFRVELSDWWSKYETCPVLENPKFWAELMLDLVWTCQLSFLELKHLPNVPWMFLRLFLHKWTMFEGFSLAKCLEWKTKSSRQFCLRIFETLVVWLTTFPKLFLHEIW